MKKAIVEIFLLIIVLFGCVLIYGRSEPSQLTTLASGLHHSSNSTKDFFEQAYGEVSTTRPTDPIAGITVNHHLLAPNLIAQEFSLVATDKPMTVLLISPNHFYRGSGGLITSSYDWQTPYGVLQTDKSLVAKFAASGLVNIDEVPFEQEHGINNIVGFIKRSLPNAKFVPLIVKENLSDSEADQMAKKLTEILPQNALVVGSLDFSHYLTSTAAMFHDTQTLAVMNNFDYGRISRLDIDSHPGLRLLLKYFDLTGNKKFVATSHENSSTISGNYNLTETTSYINGYFTAGNDKPNNARTTLYVQGLTSQDRWKPDASQRLYQYNDAVVKAKPVGLEGYNLGSGPLAVGLVYGPELTDVYFFPLDITNHLITLLPKNKADTILMKLGLTEHIKIK